MSSIYATTGRLVTEHLDELLATGWKLTFDSSLVTTDPRVVRLVGAALSLVQQHTVDSHGRCQFCTRRRAARRTRMRPCTVYSAMSFYLTQPDELVLPQIPGPRWAGPDSAATLRLPKLS